MILPEERPTKIVSCSPTYSSHSSASSSFDAAPTVEKKTVVHDADSFPPVENLCTDETEEHISQANEDAIDEEQHHGSRKEKEDINGRDGRHRIYPHM